MDLDLVIVGGGPAGIATALFLCAAAPRLRDRIVVLEKEEYPREKICAGAIGARADKLLASIGASVDVPSVAVHGLSVATRRGSMSERREAPIGRVVRRIEFDRALAARASARGVAITEGARVTGLTVTAGGVSLETTKGTMRARAVVGADGVGSFVRRAIGVPRGALSAQVVEVDTPAAAGDPLRELLHFDLTEGSLPGYGWDFGTLVDGLPLVCRGVYEIRLEGDAPASGAPDVADRLAARLARLGVDASGLRVKRFAERGLSPHEPLARPRALLVGEAAGIDPVLGEGIAQAIQYGAVAGPYLARCLASDDLSFAGWKRELGRSRVGLDLAVRARALSWVYGRRSRAAVERWVVGSGDLAHAGMRYFAGDLVPRDRLARALGSLLTSSAASLLDATRKETM